MILASAWAALRVVRLLSHGRWPCLRELFSPRDERAALLASLATFGAGFGVRPLGALVFGRIGDLIGRKYTFLVTIVTMGVSTALIGFLPTYASVGLAAPVILVALRLVQGLALGGEYGGAATYVAEHVPDARRGYYTSFIQTTATLGFFLSLGVIAACRSYFGPAGFRAYGWRVPFLLSFVLLAVSLYIRLKMSESPLFTRLKSSGQVSRNPLKESFGKLPPTCATSSCSLRRHAGQGVVWYTGQFLRTDLPPEAAEPRLAAGLWLVATALLLGTPFFRPLRLAVDRIGRKRIMLSGCCGGATYIPLYMVMRRLATPAMEASVTSLPDVEHGRDRALPLRADDLRGHGLRPIAAFLVELFPTSIRYHVDVAALPPGQRLVRRVPALDRHRRHHLAMGEPYLRRREDLRGLLYPIAISLMTVVVGGPTSGARRTTRSTPPSPPPIRILAADKTAPAASQWRGKLRTTERTRKEDFMSWDLSVYSPTGPLGSAADVRQKVSRALPGVDWSDDTCGVLQQGGYVLEFSLLDRGGAGDEDDEDLDDDSDGELADTTPVSMVVSVRGGGEPLPPLVKLCKQYGWKLGDGDSGEDIDLDSPSDEGWRDFQAFRDKVADSVSKPSGGGFLSRLFGRKKGKDVERGSPELRAAREVAWLACHTQLSG